MTGADSNATHEVVVMRTLDAPRAFVFKMWTDPRHLVNWAIPTGFAPPIIEHMDVRTGGSLRMIIRFSDDNTYLSKWSFLEVVEPERIVYDEVCDENGKPFHMARQTVEFTEHHGKTLLSIRGRIELVPDRDPKWTIDNMKTGWAEGWGDNFSKLAKYLPTVRD